MSDVYKRVSTFACLNEIYRHGDEFRQAGKQLIESGQSGSFVPGIINICLATEIFLKSINASTECLEDTQEIEGQKVYVGRNDTMTVKPGGRGHILSELFRNLPADATKEISEFAIVEDFHGDIVGGLRQYDTVFVDWRYIYEKRDPAVLGTNPLFKISNAIGAYCEKHKDDSPKVVADKHIE